MKEEKQYSDLQFQESPPKVPVHAIALAIVLFFVGSVMITIGSLMLTGYIDTKVCCFRVRLLRLIKRKLYFSVQRSNMAFDSRWKSGFSAWILSLTYCVLGMER